MIGFSNLEVIMDAYQLFQSKLGVFVVILIGFVLLPCAILGNAAYQANFIQFGLDQLLEVPNRYLGLFIHYASWAFHMGSMPLACFLLLWCDKPRNEVRKVLYSLPLIGAFLIIILLIIIKWKRHWFYTEAGQENPYKTVFMILNFTRKHKHPLQCSTFTYND